jgi:hypothetical protein
MYIQNYCYKVPHTDTNISLDLQKAFQNVFVFVKYTPYQRFFETNLSQQCPLHPENGGSRFVQIGGGQITRRHIQPTPILVPQRILRFKKEGIR